MLKKIITLSSLFLSLATAHAMKFELAAKRTLTVMGLPYDQVTVERSEFDQDHFTIEKREATIDCRNKRKTVVTFINSGYIRTLSVGKSTKVIVIDSVTKQNHIIPLSGDIAEEDAATADFFTNQPEPHRGANHSTKKSCIVS